MFMNVLLKQDIINQIKSKNFKEDILISNTRYSIYKEIDALANTKGGIIIVGIDSNFNYININNIDKVIGEISKNIYLISKKLKVKFTKTNIDNHKIILIEVDELDLQDKLLDYKRKSYIIRHNKIYLTTPLEHHYYHFINNEILPDEMSKNSNFEIGMIDLDFEESCFKKIKEASNKNLTIPQIKKYFRMKKDAMYMTFARMFCFGIHPQTYYPNYDILIYDNRKEDRFVTRITNNILYMYKETIFFLKEYLGTSLYINKDKELVRKEAYPIEVLKEVIYNAIIHRDYSKYTIGSSIEIIINEDNIKIRNPACYIYEGIQKDNIYKIPRNEMIKKINDILLDRPESDRGVSNIYNNMKKSGYIEPHIFYENGLYEVILYNKTIYDFYKGDITVKRICEYCIEPRSREEIYHHFKSNGKSTPYHFIRKYIIPLINIGVLKYEITNHTGSKNQRIITNV